MQSNCIRNTNHWIVWIEVSIVNWGNKIKHIVCGKNKRIFKVTADGTYHNHWELKGLTDI